MDVINNMLPIFIVRGCLVVLSHLAYPFYLGPAKKKGTLNNFFQFSALIRSLRLQE